MNWKKLTFGSWSWRRPFYSLAFIYGFFLLLALFAADKLIFAPPFRAAAPLPSFLTEVPAQDGEKIAAYYLAPSERMPVLLWSHGNAEDLGSLLPFFKNLHKQGYGIMAYDYPGYGFSSGKPSEAGCYNAIQAIYDHLTNSLKQPAERIILAGQSVGTGPTCYLATQEPHAGVVLFSPFLSAFRTLTRVPIFPNDRFKNSERIQEMRQPLLIIHGVNDRVIGHWHGEKLYELSPAREKRFFSVPEAGHNDLFQVASSEIDEALREFSVNAIQRKR